MQKNILKVLSSVLSVSVFLSSAPIHAVDKKRSSWTTTEKILLIAGVGIPVVAGVTTLAIVLGRNGKKNVQVPENSSFDDILDKIKFNTKDLPPGTDPHIFVTGNTGSYVDKIENDLKKYIISTKSNDREKLFAALNVYSLKVFRERYEKVFAQLAGGLNINDNIDKRRCVNAISGILHFVKNHTDKGDLNCEYHALVDTRSVAEALESVLKMPPRDLSVDMKSELKVCKWEHITPGPVTPKPPVATPLPPVVKPPVDKGGKTTATVLTEKKKWAARGCFIRLNPWWRDTPVSVLDMNLRKWIYSKCVPDREALLAALNIYSLKVFGKKYNQVVDDIKAKAGKDKGLFGCFQYLIENDERFKDYNNDERKIQCALDICRILMYVSNDGSLRKAQDLSDKYCKWKTQGVARVVASVLKSEPKDWSKEMKKEIEILKKGSWDSHNAWSLDKQDMKLLQSDGDVADDEYYREFDREEVTDKLIDLLDYWKWADKWAFEAALNIYCLKKCGKKHNDLINPIIKDKFILGTTHEDFYDSFYRNDSEFESFGVECRDVLQTICKSIREVKSICDGEYSSKYCYLGTPEKKKIADVIYDVITTPREKLNPEFVRELSMFDDIMAESDGRGPVE